MNIRSMTGYGKGQVADKERKITIEIKSVNHRFLDLFVRAPRQMNFAEEIVRSKFKKFKLTRGHFDVYIQYEDLRENKNSLKVDYALAKEYFKANDSLAKNIGLDNTLRSFDVLLLEDVISIKEEEDDDNAIKELFDSALSIAIKQILECREKEGENLANDIFNKLSFMDSVVLGMEMESNSTIKLHIEKLRERIQSILGDIPIDEEKLMNEIVFYSDKVGIDEEITRLKSHIQSLKDELLNEKDSVGKKLDFIIQEMNREVNTIGSKCANINITHEVVELKMMIEKIREQVQNIE